MEDLDFSPYEDDGEKNTPRLIPDTESVDSTGLPVLQQPVTDILPNDQLYLPQGESIQVAKVSWRVLDEYGKLVGTYSDNLMLNTLMYDVEFPDGATKPYAANMIAENIHNSVDSDGHQYRFFGDILNYCKTPNAVAIDDATVVERNRRRYQRKTTSVWNLLIWMKDLSNQFYPLKDTKESYPVQVDEYAVAKFISNETVFSWWVPYTIKKRNFIIAAIKSRLKLATHKYGVEIPTSIEHAILLDAINGNRL